MNSSVQKGDINLHFINCCIMGDGPQRTINLGKTRPECRHVLIKNDAPNVKLRV